MLEIESISRSFGGRAALNDVSFTVNKGRMTGFVGGNGAGKTTTMRIILGVLSADSGRVTLNGTPLSSADRTRFGYMPEERGLYPKMKIAEQIVYLGRLHGMSATDAERSTKGLLERLDLAERANDTLESLSLGNQQRAQIAAALVHEPEVLILDEPFSGLDPLAVETVQGVLGDYAAQGAPVLFSSHQLDIVERLCDDLIIIAEGSIRASGSKADLRREHSRDRFELETDNDLGWLREESGIDVVDFDGGYALFEANNEDSVRRVLQHAVNAGHVRRFAPNRPTLAQIFKEVIQ